MDLRPFFFGVIVSLPPVLLLMKLSRGRFFMISNTYLAGVLYAFWLWVFLMLLVYIDTRFNLIGLADSAEGFGLITIFTAALRGFLVGGLAAAFASKYLLRRKP